MRQRSPIDVHPRLAIFLTPSGTREKPPFAPNRCYDESLDLIHLPRPEKYRLKNKFLKDATDWMPVRYWIYENAIGLELVNVNPLSTCYRREARICEAGGLVNGIELI